MAYHLGGDFPILRSVAIFRETRNGVRPISGVKIRAISISITWFRSRKHMTAALPHGYGRASGLTRTIYPTTRR